GNRSGSSPRSLVVVLPEGAPDRERPKRQSRSVILAIAALGMALGAIVLGSLTAPDPEAAPESTTTTATDDVEQPIDFEDFTIAEIERGTPFDWVRAHSVSDGFPLALFEHEGWNYLFATDVPSFAGRVEGGLRAWRSEDGVEWQSLGQVIGSEHSVNNAESTLQGLVAVESGTGDGEFALWRSDDGIEWWREVIETGGPSAGTRYGHAIGGNDHILMVTATPSVDLFGQLEDRLPDVLEGGLDITRLPWSPEFTDRELLIVVWGPLGFPIVEISGDELGLTDEEMADLERAWNGPGSDLEAWVSAEPGHWFQSELPDASWINSITPTPNGEILAAGWGHQSNAIWSSIDGVNWGKIETFTGPDEIENWNGLLVGPYRSGSADILTSVDGHQWEPIGLREHLPGQLQWNIAAMATGPGGVGATIDGWSSSTFVPDDEPVVLTDGEATLSINFSTGSYQVESGEIVRRWSMNSSLQPEGVILDLAGQRVTFHAESGEELASFTLGQLTDAESEFWNATAMEDRHNGFVFSRDGEDWTIQDAGEAMQSYIMMLEVTDSHVIAAVASLEGRFSPQTSPGFEIWSAPIP
ncbi:MAG TPA: hypothetical protein VFZ80_03345, partial [Acidimicrobiia bacterium]